MIKDEKSDSKQDIKPNHNMDEITFYIELLSISISIAIVLLPFFFNEIKIDFGFYISIYIILILNISLYLLFVTKTDQDLSQNNQIKQEFTLFYQNKYLDLYLKN